jgi:DNA phosphorothioation-dependent restriction protein DptG
MKYSIDYQGIQKTFKFVQEDQIEHAKLNLQHNTGIRFKMLPFTVKESSAVQEFTGVVGEFSRLMLQCKKEKNLVITDVIEEAIQEVNPAPLYKSTLREILKELFIVRNEGGVEDLYIYPNAILIEDRFHVNKYVT